jgi:hypothetical protein
LIEELEHNTAFFSIFIDTNSKISQFLPSVPINRSLRHTKGVKLFPPILLLQFVREQVRSWWDDPSGFDDLLIKQGRFLWGSLGKSSIELVDTGRAKLNRGVDPYSENSFLTDELAIAILASRVSLFFDYSIKIAEQLINGHMALCYFVSKDRNHLWFCYPSETTLSLAAASILKNEQFSWAKCIKKITDYTQVGAVVGGYRGELLSKILLMATWDSCQSKAVHTNLTVKDFLIQLGGKALIEAVKINNCKKGETDRFLKGKLFFTHFTYVTYSLSSENELMDFCQKGQAIFCKLQQTAIDLLIPVVLDTETNNPRFTFIAVQCKNHLLYDSDGHGSAEENLTAEKAGFKSWKLPYLVLFMSLGAFNKSQQNPNIQSLIKPKGKNLNSKLLI